MIATTACEKSFTKKNEIPADHSHRHVNLAFARYKIPFA